ASPTEVVATSSEAITGGDTNNVTLSSTMPYRAVGFLSFPNAQCSATAIQRDVILTAAHCFYNNGGVTHAQAKAGAITFHLLINSSTGPVDINGGAGIASREFATLATADIRDGDGQTAEKNRFADLGIVLLTRNLTTQELPNVSPVELFNPF